MMKLPSLLLSIKTRLVDTPLFKDSFWALLGSILGKGLPLLAGILVARFLGKEMYGQYGLLKNTLINIAVFSTLGLGYTGTRFIAKSISEGLGDFNDIVRVIYRITTVVSSLIAILVFVFSKQLAVFIKAPDLSGSLRLTAIIVVFNAINTSQIGILSGFKAFKQIAKNNTYAGIVTFLVSGLLAYFWSLDGALVALLISMLFNVCINYVSIRSYYKRISSLSLTGSKVSLKEIISFSIPIALQESMYTVVHFMSSFLLISYAGYGELGIISAASQWSSVILFIPGVLKNVMLSYFSSSESTVSLRKRMILINGSATLLPWLIITVFSGLIARFYGATYNNLNIVLSIACSLSIFSSISSVIIYEFISLGKNWLMFLLRTLRDGATLLITWWCLASIHSIQASIISTSVASIVGFVFMVLLLLIANIHSSPHHN